MRPIFSSIFFFFSTFILPRLDPAPGIHSRNIGLDVLALKLDNEMEFYNPLLCHISVLHIQSSPCIKLSRRRNENKPYFIVSFLNAPPDFRTNHNWCTLGHVWLAPACSLSFLCMKVCTSQRHEGCHKHPNWILGGLQYSRTSQLIAFTSGT